MMTSRTLWLALISVALLTLSPGLYADLYRWVDENGKVHYSDTPPPPSATRSKELQAPVRAAPPAAAGEEAAQPKTYIEREAEFRKRQVEKAEKQAAQDKEKEAAEAKKRRCDSARTQLAGLQAGGRVTRYNEKGERVFLSDAEIQDQIARARTEVGAACN